MDRTLWLAGAPGGVENECRLVLAGLNKGCFREWALRFRDREGGHPGCHNLRLAHQLFKRPNPQRLCFISSFSGFLCGEFFFTTNHNNLL